jgi:ABC-type transport system involved in cytochrome bd biosynthesis fused ATPase/permease subunit
LEGALFFETASHLDLENEALLMGILKETFSGLGVTHLLQIQTVTGPDQ